MQNHANKLNLKHCTVERRVQHLVEASGKDLSAAEKELLSALRSAPPAVKEEFSVAFAALNEAFPDSGGN